MTYALLLEAVRDDAERRPAFSVSSQSAAAPTDDVDDEGLLVARVRRGDIAAFDRIFERWWLPLWRFARAELPGDAVAEDVVQQVFARLWVRHAQWAPHDGVQAYLYGSVRNAMIDWRRHERVVHAHAHAERAVPDDGAQDGSDAAAERNDLLVRLEQALAKLPDARRQAIVLRYEHGLTYAQLAAVLGVSPAAAEKQVARALDTVRAWMNGPGARP
jgi:RNA polymerase sigma-70 factor (ECF subfamily)